MTGGDLDISEVNAGVEHGRDENVAEHMRVRPGGLDASGHGELAQAAGASMTVHPGAAAVEQDWPSVPAAYCPVDGTADRWQRRDLDYLGALAAHAQHSVAALLAEVGDVCEPGRPSMATSAKSHGFGDSRAAVSRAGE